MTTIAFDKTHIAWDSQITAGGEKLSVPAEKVWIVGKKVYAFAGDYGMLDPVIDWHSKGARVKGAPEGNWELLVVDTKGAYIYSSDVPRKALVVAPYAMGSGSHFARGALMAGATAYQSVKIACQCDIYSGGEVNSRAFDEVF